MRTHIFLKNWKKIPKKNLANFKKILKYFNIKVLICIEMAWRYRLTSGLILTRTDFIAKKYSLYITFLDLQNINFWFFNTFEIFFQNPKNLFRIMKNSKNFFWAGTIRSFFWNPKIFCEMSTIRQGAQKDRILYSIFWNQKFYFWVGNNIRKGTQKIEYGRLESKKIFFWWGAKR